MSIKAGDLRHPVTLLKPETTLNEAGRRVTRWAEIPAHAAKNDVSGKEFWSAHAINAEDIVTWTIRWRDDIDTTWRIRHGAATYDILEVNHLGYMRDYLRLKSRIVTGGGH